MKPEDEQFQEDIEMLDVLFKRMADAKLIVGHGHRDDTKIIGAEFTPDGQEVVTTIAALDKVLSRPTNRQIVLFWRYVVEFANTRRKRGGGDDNTPAA